LRAVVWKPHAPLRSGDIAPEVKDTLQVLHKLALQAPAPTSLAAYVKVAFEEMLA